MSDTPSAQNSDPVNARAVDEAPRAWLARVNDEPVTELPEDLYIPPEALRVFLDSFEGPLDLLLYLIRRQNLDILAINVAAVTHQYIEYVELMEVSGIDLAAEYLLMAAMLAEIKSRTLLPRPPKGEDEDEEDPTATLVRRLQEYEQIKQAAETLDTLPRQGRDWFGPQVGLPDIEPRVIYPDVELDALLGALKHVMHQASLTQSHQISRETLSTRERMMAVMTRLDGQGFVAFEALFTLEEGRAGVVVTFMAILELAKERLLEIVQNTPTSPIHVRARIASDGGETDEGDSSPDDEPAFEVPAIDNEVSRDGE
ncbi:segregation and condensation protein A [Larsenimonas suaedae]|uniref:Segregation and condensation protein A n=1 Tax=Larsenimonas suaedae TaxID=1851019 RepID=A0ABU1GTV0_9GAMM|nr:ScpA family protein [Larsenimonas suaedae]MCM2971903.1 segregation/condensation protein A [Larsenimonas suaedae]MDR5895455.1 ScpA family protein [Larsenimonas suaedae]